MRASKDVNELVRCSLHGVKVVITPDPGGKMFALYVNGERVAEASAPRGSQKLSKFAFENGALKVDFPFDLRIEEEYR